MELLPMTKLHKFSITIDDNPVAQFYHTSDMNFQERRELAEEYAQYNFISSKEVKIYPVSNDGKLGGRIVMPHYGQIG